jgi:hypothetical protein
MGSALPKAEPQANVRGPNKLIAFSSFACGAERRILAIKLVFEEFRVDGG